MNIKFLKNRKILIPAAVLLVLLAFAASLRKPEKAPGGKTQTAKISPEELLNVKQEVFSFTVEGFDKERNVEWGLEGESASVVLDKINIKNLKAVYNGDDMDFTILADRAVFDKKSQDIELEKNIVGRTSDGSELVTDFAKWHAKSEEVTSDAHVTVTRENLICKGKGFLARPRLKQVSLTKEVDVNFSEGKRITCDGPFEIDNQKHIAIFNNNVKVADKDSDMYTDKLTVYLTPDTNEVRSVVTEGNVKVVHRGELDKIGDFGQVTF